MPKFALTRFYDPVMTRAQLDGHALQGIAALQNYIYRGGDRPLDTDHGIQWLRSYWQPGGTWGICVYEAPDLRVLSDFQELCGTPFLAAREVEEVETRLAAESAEALLATEFTAAGTATPSDVPAAAAKHLGESSELVRAYWDRASRLVTALYQPRRSDDELRAGAGTGAMRVVEINPEEYR